MRDTIIAIFLAVLLSSILGVGICATIDAACRQASEANEAIAAYNNGICTECGGKYHFSGSGLVWYYYTCEQCDHTIRSKVIMK